MEALKDLDLDHKISIAERDYAASERDTKRIYQRNLRALTESRDQIEKLLIEIIAKLTNISSSEVNLNFEFPELPDWVEME